MLANDSLSLAPEKSKFLLASAQNDTERIRAVFYGEGGHSGPTYHLRSNSRSPNSKLQ